MVITLTSESVVREFDGFFQSVNILSITAFGREVKPWVPCRRFTARKRTSEQNLSDFSRSVSEAALMTLDVKKCRKTQAITTTTLYPPGHILAFKNTFNGIIE